MFSAYPVEATRSGYCHHSMVTSMYPAMFSSFHHNNISLSSELYYSIALQGLSYDHHLDLSSKCDIKVFLARVERMSEEISCIHKDSLNIDQQIDLELIVNQLQLELVKWRQLKQHQKDPSLYLPFEAINYLLPNWGPSIDPTVPSVDPRYKWEELSHPGVAHLSPFLRLVAILSRLRQLPYVLSTGIDNLVEPVKIFVERATSMCDSFVNFLEFDFKNLTNIIVSFETSLEPKLLYALETEIVFASKVAIYSITRFKVHITESLLHIATDNVAIGKEAYDKLLKLDHMIPDSSHLLTLGLEHFKTVKFQLEQTAAKISPGKTWQEITEGIIRSCHPTADCLLEAYMAEIKNAKSHMIKYDLIPPLPEDEKVIGMYTPSCLLPFSPFGDFLNPSSFAGMDMTKSSKVHTGYLMLHPIGNRGLTLDEEERLLRYHDYSWIRVLAAHECYPGHHVQLLLTQTNSRIIRKYYQSAYFYEGWGLYCEQLAYETGFFANNKERLPIIPEDQVRLTQLRLQLWRAARVILDIKLHTEELSFQECVDFLCSEVMLDSCSATSEVLMYVTRPTYFPCYIIGLLKILELRELEKQQCMREERVFELQMFHSKLLKCGSLPFPLINKLISN